MNTLSTLLGINNSTVCGRIRVLIAQARWWEREKKGIRTWDSGCWEWRLIGASKPSEWNSLFHGRYSPAFASPDPLSSPVSSTRFRFRPGYSPRSRRNSTAVETLRPTLPPCTCYACDGTEPPRLIWLNWKIKRLFRGNKLSRPIAAYPRPSLYTRALYTFRCFQI